MVLRMPGALIEHQPIDVRGDLLQAIWLMMSGC